MAFKLGSDILSFFSGKGFDSVLKAAEFIPVIGTYAKTIEVIKDAAISHPDWSKLSPEEQKQALDMFIAESARMKQQDDAQLAAERVRLEDVANARAREIAIAQAGKKDWMMKMTGCIGLGAFLLLVYAIIFVKIPIENKDIFNIVAGGIIGTATTIFGYYYGSSKGSADKTEILKQT